MRMLPDTVIVSPDAIIRWRILRRGTGSTVERSVDGGVTWQAQQTGVSVPLTAGASPSPSVCWLVGASGTVLLSTGGASWQRVAFPEVTDLTSVSATDDKHATVTTSDGRIFITTDGGAKWIVSPQRH